MTELQEKESHKGRSGITLGMLAVSVIISTVILGRNLWRQEKEEIKLNI